MCIRDRYCWGFSARNALPIFVSSGSSRPADLKHGENCLFVNNDAKSWGTATNLLSTHYAALRKIALRARHDAYFNFSIQKKIKDVTEIICRATPANTFFDKFLPL